MQEVPRGTEGQSEPCEAVRSASRYPHGQNKRHPYHFHSAPLFSSSVAVLWFALSKMCSPLMGEVFVLPLLTAPWSWRNESNLQR